MKFTFFPLNVSKKERKKEREKTKLTIQCTGFIIIDSDIVEMASVILEIKSIVSNLKIIIIIKGKNTTYQNNKYDDEKIL